MLISSELKIKLIFLVTRSLLVSKDNYLFSKNDLDIRYPIINDIPILINHDNSIFSI
jgi:hypothetical protein